MLSKSVTSCASMTAHFVLLAQTKVGFLSGSRSKKMRQVCDTEVTAQLEEAYARATVALTRAQKLCIIMGPQRTSTAWQGAQAQKLTVSLLLPGEGTAVQWRDFLQSKRRFWPTMSHRYAALAPLREDVLQRERRHMRAKHLWDSIDIDWYELGKKLKVTEPTGLSRQYLWDLLFVKNPFQEGKYKSWDFKEGCL